MDATNGRKGVKDGKKIETAGDDGLSLTGSPSSLINRIEIKEN